MCSVQWRYARWHWSTFQGLLPPWKTITSVKFMLRQRPLITVSRVSSSVKIIPLSFWSWRKFALSESSVVGRLFFWLLRDVADDVFGHGVQSHEFDSSRWNYAQWMQRKWTHDGRPSPPAAAGTQKEVGDELPWRLSVDGDARRRSEPMKQSAWDKSIFHLFRARALPSVCPATHRPSVGQCPSGKRSRAEPSGRWHRVVCMTVASAAVATNLQSSLSCRCRRCACSNSRPPAAAAATAASGRAESHHTLSRPTLTFVVRY